MVNVVCIEESVTLDANLPSVGERYFTHYYYVPKNQLRRVPVTSDPFISESLQTTEPSINLSLDEKECLSEVPYKKIKLSEQDAEMVDTKEITSENMCPPNANCLIKGASEQVQSVPIGYTVTGCESLVMVHSNKLCLVSLSPHHPVVRLGLTVTKVTITKAGATLC